MFLLKNTDDNKILDVISIVDAFNSSLSINSLVEQSSCVPKQNIVLPTEILGQGIDQIPLQKYDIIRAKIGGCEHYGVIYKIDTELNIASNLRIYLLFFLTASHKPLLPLL